MFGTLVTFFFSVAWDFIFCSLYSLVIHLVFSVACTVLLYTWHGALNIKEGLMFYIFYTLDIIDFLLLCHMINDQLVKCYYCRLSALTTQLYDVGK